MRRPPNLHLHSFQRISREWKVWRSLEGTISLSAFSSKEEGLERAYGKLAAPSRCRGGSKRGASSGDREAGSLSCVQTTESSLRGYAARPLKSRPEKQPRAALSETSPPPSSIITKTCLYIETCRKIFGKVHRCKQKFLAANLKLLHMCPLHFLPSANTMDIKKGNIFLTHKTRDVS